MITKNDLYTYFGKLINDMFPEQVARYFGFSDNPKERFWASSQNQNPRDNVQTMIYFSCKNSSWKTDMAVVTKYSSQDVQYTDEMRQVILDIDICSKIMPPGTAQDIAHYISNKLQSDYLEDWQNQNPEYLFAFESLKVLDLSALLQTQTWTERQRCSIKFNFRDNVVLSKVQMTKIPESVETVHDSVDFTLNMKKQ